MARYRVARGRSRADQVLAFHPAGRHPLRQARRRHQTALAHRTRLSGAETGSRPRPLRRPGLARLPSPRDALHRRLRVPGRRKGDDSPLRTSPPQAIPSPFRFPSSRTRAIRPCALSATSQTRSQRCDADWPPPSLANSQDVPAASDPTLSGAYDAVVLCGRKLIDPREIRSRDEGERSGRLRPKVAETILQWSYTSVQYGSYETRLSSRELERGRAP